jgi:hypothetical protein
LTPLLAQGTKPPAKRVHPPQPKLEGSYEAIDPIVIPSRGCVDDYVKMRSMAGVAQRKLLQDLVQTGCIIELGGVFHVTLVNEEIYKGLVDTFVIIDVDVMKQFRPKQLDELLEAQRRSLDSSDKISTDDVMSQSNVYIELAKCATLEQFKKATSSAISGEGKQKEKDVENPKR